MNEMHDMLINLVPLFFLTALVYASVGFGGGSTYLALMAMAGVPFKMMPTTALICNLVVVSGASARFLRDKKISLRLVLPFLISSMPMAYIGGSLSVSHATFFILLGISLLAASLRLFFHERQVWIRDGVHVTVKQALVIGLPAGAVLGFISGMTGIGGGIFLSPILFLLKWADAKRIAAAASVFILMNSLTGLAGQVVKNGEFPEAAWMIPLMVAVLIGGQMGTSVNLKWLSPISLRRVTAVLVFVVALNVIWKGII